MRVNGLIDLHIHTAPDIRERRYDDVAQARLARQHNAHAIVLKSHVTTTSDRARIAAIQVPGIKVFGGVVLNRCVGGINPEAVRVAIAMGARIVWMPTLDARNHRQRERGQNEGLEILHHGKLSDPTREVLDLIAAADIAVATGHLSHDELFALLEAATDRGIRRQIINHPEHWVTDLNHAQQAEIIRRFPAFLERCYAQPTPQGYQENLAANLAAVKALGADRTVIATDCGQVENTAWAEALSSYLDHFAEGGISDAELVTMARANPAFLLGIEEVEAYA